MIAAIAAAFCLGLLFSWILDAFAADLKRLVQKEVALSLGRVVSANEEK